MSHEHYTGIVVRWIDGDTVEVYGTRAWVYPLKAFGVELTLALTARKKGGYRLVIVDTPERGQPGYKEAIEYVNRLIPPGTAVEFYTHGDENAGWGRTLADVLVPGQGTTTVSSKLLQDGMGKVWEPR